MHALARLRANVPTQLHAYTLTHIHIHKFIATHNTHTRMRCQQKDILSQKKNIKSTAKCNLHHHRHGVNKEMISNVLSRQLVRTPQSFGLSIQPVETILFDADAASTWNSTSNFPAEKRRQLTDYCVAPRQYQFRGSRAASWAASKRTISLRLLTIRVPLRSPLSEGAHVSTTQFLLKREPPPREAGLVPALADRQAEFQPFPLHAPN